MTSRAREVIEIDTWRLKKSLQRQHRWQHYRLLRRVMAWLMVGVLGVVLGSWVRGW